VGYIIETGIPVPPIAKSPRTSERVEILKVLKIGQSVLFEVDEGKRFNIPLIAGRRYTTRKVDDTHFRVWRIEQKKESAMSEKFLASDGIEPAPGDDDPKPHVVEPEEDEDDDDDDEEPENPEEDDDDEDDDEDDD